MGKGKKTKKPRIRPLALGVFWRPDGHLLINRSHDSVKGETFYRPLGGGIKFGESAADALRREIMEEIGATITNLRLLETFENRFVYEGKPGHEIIRLFGADFEDSSFHARDPITGIDDGNEPIHAEWRPLSFYEGGPPLYPDGLLAVLNREVQ